MSSPSSVSSAIQHAEHLLRLVKSLADPVATATGAAGPDSDSLARWNAKTEIQRVCDRLLESTMGPLQYTVVLAGKCTAVVCVRRRVLRVAYGTRP
jgi:hypothetical protein